MKKIVLLILILLPMLGPLPVEDPGPKHPKGPYPWPTVDVTKAK